MRNAGDTRIDAAASEANIKRSIARPFPVDAAADGCGNVGPGKRGTADFENCSDDERLPDGQGAGADAGAEGVGDVVAADVEGHEDAEHGGEDEQRDPSIADVADTPVEEIDGDHRQDDGKEQVEIDVGEDRGPGLAGRGLQGRRHRDSERLKPPGGRFGCTQKPSLATDAAS